MEKGVEDVTGCSRTADGVKRVDRYFRSRDRAPSFHRVTYAREPFQSRYRILYTELPTVPKICFSRPSPTYSTTMRLIER